MNLERLLRSALVSGAVCVLAPASARADALSFHPLPPCRIVDTRIWNAGTPSQAPLPLAAAEVRAFDAIGLDLRGQGGALGGCGVPPEDGGDARLRAESIAVNLVAVNAAGAGDLRVFPGDAPAAPLASVINYALGQTVATGTVIPLRTDAVGDDFKIQADVSGTHVVVDVVGYFSRASSTALVSRLRNLPSSTGAFIPQFGALAGIDVASGTSAPHTLRINDGCRVGRLHVEESTASPSGGGTRIYLLRSGSTILLSCGTGFTGACARPDAVAVPAGGELYYESQNIGAVPATDVLFTLEMVCN